MAFKSFKLHVHLARKSEFPIDIDIKNQNQICLNFGGKNVLLKVVVLLSKFSSQESCESSWGCENSTFSSSSYIHSLTLLSQLGKVEFYCRLTHAEMPVTRCKFVDAARAMKIYALTKKRPSMTMIIGVSSRGGYVLGVHRRKPQTIHATNEIHDKCATIFISCFMLGKPLQNFTFFLLEF